MPFRRQHFQTHFHEWILINISLKFVPKGLINNIPALVQIMARRRPGDKPLSKPMMFNLLTHICVTRPQWVNEGCLICRVGFCPSETCLFRTKWKKMDKTCFVQFLPSKTGRNNGQFGQNGHFTQLVNYISAGQGLSRKLLLMLLKYPIAQTMRHFSCSEMPPLINCTVYKKWTHCPLGMPFSAKP